MVTQLVPAVTRLSCAVQYVAISVVEEGGDNDAEEAGEAKAE
jgi:hypothetical protein